MSRADPALAFVRTALGARCPLATRNDSSSNKHKMSRPHGTLLTTPCRTSDPSSRPPPRPTCSPTSRLKSCTLPSSALLTSPPEAQLRPSAILLRPFVRDWDWDGEQQRHCKTPTRSTFARRWKISFAWRSHQLPSSSRQPTPSAEDLSSSSGSTSLRQTRRCPSFEGSSLPPQQLGAHDLIGGRSEQG